MSIDSKYNSQFIQIDFSLLDDPAFLEFVHRAEFATYLVLRRYVWRGGEHRLGLHELYAKQHLLAASVGTSKIAQMLGGRDLTRVSKHLTYLQKVGVVRRIRTGRENIFILGEWHTPPGWAVSKEFYYLENCFGTRKSDLTRNAKSDLTNQQAKSELAESAKSDLPLKTGQSWRKSPSSNREMNRGQNTVNGLRQLPDQDLEAGKSNYLVQEILDRLGDEHSRNFYRLVAAKVPEHVIRKALSEIKADGAEHPAKLFTFRMGQYALRRIRGQDGPAAQVA